MNGKRSMNRFLLNLTFLKRVMCICFTSIILMGLISVRAEASTEAEDYKTAVQRSEVRESLQHYLDLDCGASAPGKNWPPSVLERLLRTGADRPEIQTSLIRLLRSGPSDEYIAAITRTLESDWSDLKTFLDESTDLPFQPADKQILQKLMNSREVYVQRQIARLTKRYQERAAIALYEFASHGSGTAKAALSEIMNTGSPASKAAIKQARDRLGKSLGSGRGQ